MHVMNALPSLNFRGLCSQILDINAGIGSVEITTADGQIMATQQRDSEKGILPQNREEFELIILQSLLRMNTRRSTEKQFGKVQYSFTEYERIKRTTIVWRNENSKAITTGQDIVVMLSIDREIDHQPIISKVQTLLNQINCSNINEVPK
jgi:hypothetical protein